MAEIKIESTDKVRAERGEDGILVITLNSPKNLNALSQEIIAGLDEIVEKIWYERGLEGVIIRGEGKAFSAGANISELFELENIHQAYEYLRRGQRVLSKIENLKYITVAAIHGWALGGGFELALSCTFRVATKTAKVGLPEINLGIIPGYGGTQRLSRLIGIQNAKKLIMEGVHLDGEKAYQLGMVDEICGSEEELIPKSKEIIKKFSGKNPTALRYANELCNLSYSGDFEENLKTEAIFCASLISSPFAKTKMQEFLEKRKERK